MNGKWFVVRVGEEDVHVPLMVGACYPKISPITVSAYEADTPISRWCAEVMLECQGLYMDHLSRRCREERKLTDEAAFVSIWKLNEIFSNVVLIRVDHAEGKSTAEREDAVIENADAAWDIEHIPDKKKVELVELLKSIQPREREFEEEEEEDALAEEVIAALEEEDEELGRRKRKRCRFVDVEAGEGEEDE